MLDNEMLDIIYKLPDKYNKAISIAKDSIRGLRFHNIVNVVIIGLGDSVIGAELARLVTQRSIVIPIMVSKGFELPAFVDEKTLVITLSYTGNDEEILLAYNEAKKRKAKVLAITSGGKLKKFASSSESPVIIIPQELPLKSTIGYFFFPILIVFIEQGIVRKRSLYNVDAAIESLKKLREKFRPEVPECKNKAKILAKSLYGKLPVICGTSDLTYMLAVRWKFLLNNTKQAAFFDILPKLNVHDILVNKDLLNKLQIVILNSSTKDRPIKRRFDSTINLLNDLVAGITYIETFEDTALMQTIYYLILSDYTTAYLSILNKYNYIEEIEK